MDGNSNPLPRYPGPKGLEDALSTLLLQHQHEGEFHREGLRADSEYRDLGLARATGGRIGAKLIRAIGPFEKPTGWHWHDMQAHFIYVLKGWIRFRFAGVHEDVTLTAGAALSQPAGVPHNVVARSHDFEVIEITMPGNYGSFDLAGERSIRHYASQRYFDAGPLRSSHCDSRTFKLAVHRAEFPKQ